MKTFFLAGDFNIGINTKTKDTNNHLSDFNDNFSLTNLINSKTCFKSPNGTILDIFLTNRPKRFQNTSTVETGLSDCHKMIITSLKAFFKKLPPKKIIYRNYKKFDKDDLLYELDQEMIKRKFYLSKKPYENFTEIFKKVTDKHAPLKQKFIRGNNGPFMTKDLRKVIMNRSGLKKEVCEFCF